MIDKSRGLSFLFARLNHPSGMVRERTCVALAGLLVRADTFEAVKTRLGSWLESQNFESVAISALLIWIRAKMEDSSVHLPEPSELLEKFPRPSLLSWLLSRDLYGIDPPKLDWQQCCSEQAPPGFEPDPVFYKYCEQMIGDFFLRAAHKIDERSDGMFSSQWAWEWSHLVQTAQCKTRESVFWQKGRPDAQWYPSYNFRLTEAYRSALLRALAWTQGNGCLRLQDALHHASIICPIDLALWRIEAGRRPAWWPKTVTHTGLIDTAAGDVIAQVETLLEKGIPGREDWILAQANGYMGGDEIRFYMEIYGAFQWCVGRKHPDLREVGEWCRRSGCETFERDSYLSTSGKLLPPLERSHPRERQFGHWVLSPLFEIVPTPLGANWQWWRYYRKLWAPASYLFDNPCELQPSAEAMLFKREGQIVGFWMDWTDGLTGTLDANLPPFSGQCLLVRRDLLNAKSFPVRPSLCWIWSLSIFQRDHGIGKFRIITHEGQIGATGLISV